MPESGWSELPRPSPREIELLTLAAHGHTNAEIAALLGVAEQSVNNQMGRLRQKIGASTRAHAVVVALQEGWLRLEDIPRRR